MTPPRPALAAVLIVLVSACGSSKASTKASNRPATTQATSATPRTTVAPALGAAALLKQATQDGVVRGWAHLAVKLTGAGHIGAYSSDAGPSTGRQIIDIDQQHGTVLLVGGTAYIQGNATATSGFFGFAPSQAPRLTNTWVSLSPSDSGYAGVTDGVTLASALSEVGLDAPLTLDPPSTVDGQHVVGISGQLPASASSGTGPGTLYVTTGSKPLPVEFTATTSDGVQTVTFSAWGVPVALSAPAAAVPSASIPAS